MNRSSRFAIVGVAAIFTVAGSIALAQNAPPAKDGGRPATNKAPAAAPAKPNTPAAAAPGHDQMPQLPPGWTPEDMQACMAAGTPGPMHARLAESVGVWNGKNTMWMAPGTEPMKTDSSATITSIMDGRFTKCEATGDMPGMGPFNGFGIYGYDNVTQKFQATWIDNCGTGMMTGTGEMSSDGKTMTWTYNFTCPITKKPTTMREVDHRTGKDSMTMEMYSTDPKSGKEFKMMEIVYTRKPGTTATAPAPTNTR